MQRHASVAGVLAGLALIGEFVFFMASGFSPQVFADPSAAITFLAERGAFIRIAVLFGVAGVVLRTIFVVALAERLRPETPLRAAGALFYAILGSVGHGLVALTFWLGIPALVGVASADPAAARSAWPPFSVITTGFEGFGNTMLAASMLSAGWAVIARRALPVSVGWVGVLAGLTTLARIFTTGTPAAPLGMVAWFPSLILAVVFLIWGGVALRRAQPSSVIGSTLAGARAPG